MKEQITDELIDLLSSIHLYTDAGKKMRVEIVADRIMNIKLMDKIPEVVSPVKSFLDYNDEYNIAEWSQHSLCVQYRDFLHENRFSLIPFSYKIGLLHYICKQEGVSLFDWFTSYNYLNDMIKGVAIPHEMILSVLDEKA